MPSSATSPVPTLTPVETTTSTPTPKPGKTTPASTADFTATAMVEAIIATAQPEALASYPSPDMQWQVELVRYDCVDLAGGYPHAYEQLKLIRKDHGIEHFFEAQLLYCGGLGAGGLGGLFWSPNSRYFYYTDAREGVPDGSCGYWQRTIYRLDVLTHDLELVGAGHLSPDNTKLAMWQNHELAIWNLDEGEIGLIPALAPDAMPADIAWSPDNSAFVYQETAFDCLPFGQSYLVRVDLPGFEQTLLLESDAPGFGFVEWIEPNQLELTDDEFNHWKYDLVTKELWQVP